MNALFTSIGRAIGRVIPSSTVRGWILERYYSHVRGRQVVKTTGGIRFALDLDELIDVSVSLGVFEVAVQRALARHCKPGMHVLDIGANIGAHALAIARHVQPHGVVYGFEPTQYAYQKLRRNAELNPDLPIRCFRVALSDHEEGNQEIHFRSSWLTNGGRKDQPCSVDFVQLDRWASTNLNGGTVSVIKMDVDGNEFPIIMGGERLLLRDRPVFVMEAVAPHFAEDDRNPFRWLWHNGWRIFTLDGKHRFSSLAEVAALLPRDDPLMTKSINVLAIHESTPA